MKLSLSEPQLMNEVTQEFIYSRFRLKSVLSDRNDA